MKYKNIILFSLAMLFLVACGSEDSPTKPDDTEDQNTLGIPVGEYSPAKKSSKWVYSYEIDGEIKIYTKTVTGVRKFDSGDYVEFEIGAEGEIPIKSYVKFENDKYYMLSLDANNGGIIGDFETIYIDPTAEKGDTWESSATTISNIGIIHRSELFEKLSSYIVDGKTYHDVIAIKTRAFFVYPGNIESLGLEQVHYHAKGVGLIKLIADNGNSHLEQKLLEYTE